MGRKHMEIKTVSYIRVNGELVRFDDLPPELKQRAATELKIRYMNNLFRGRAVFVAEEQESAT